MKVYIIWGRSPKMELCSRGWAPYNTGSPHPEVSVLGTHLYQCTSWHCCDRPPWASVTFGGEDSQCVCPFCDGWFKSPPAKNKLSVQQFCHRQHEPCAPPSRFTYSCAELLFFWFPWMIKSLKRETFWWCRRGKTNKQTKRWKHQKVSKSMSSKTVLNSRENFSIGALHQMESTYVYGPSICPPWRSTCSSPLPIF